MSKKRDLQREFRRSLNEQLKDYKAPKMIQRDVSVLAAAISRALETASSSKNEQEIYQNVLALVRFNLGAGVLIGMKMEHDAKPAVPAGYKLVPLDPIKDSPAYKM